MNVNHKNYLHQVQQQRRRQSLLTKSVQEEQLIQQVKLRPVLYDKSLKAYRKPGATDNAWAEIAHVLEVKVEDCKKRWKSLRDTFIKYFRQEIVTVPGMKRKKWVYYEQMSFLRAHVELFGIAETDSASDKETIASDSAPRVIHISEYVTDQTEYLTCEDAEDDQFENQTEYIYEEVEEPETTTYTIPQKQDPMVEVSEIITDDQAADSTLIHHDDGDHEDDLDLTPENGEAITVPITVDDGSESVSDPTPNSRPPVLSITDPDERFLLSCAPVLKRLSTQKNALVKLKIQQLLYEVEFGEN